jgi:hypothetical protein
LIFKQFWSWSHLILLDSLTPQDGYSLTTWTRWGGREAKNVCFNPRSGYKNCPPRGGGIQKKAKFCPRSCWLPPKIQQTKMLVTCQRFGDWFLFGLVWPYSSNQKNIMKVGSKSFLLTCSINKLWAYLYYIFLIRRESWIFVMAILVCCIFDCPHLGQDDLS